MGYHTSCGASASSLPGLGGRRHINTVEERNAGSISCGEGGDRRWEALRRRQGSRPSRLPTRPGEAEKGDRQQLLGPGSIASNYKRSQARRDGLLEGSIVVNGRCWRRWWRRGLVLKLAQAGASEIEWSRRGRVISAPGFSISGGWGDWTPLALRLRICLGMSAPPASNP
jgi:hypothetical protein